MAAPHGRGQSPTRMDRAGYARARSARSAVPHIRAKAQLLLVSLVVVGIDGEFVRRYLLEELLELRDFRLDLFLGHLVAFELDP